MVDPVEESTEISQVALLVGSLAVVAILVVLKIFACALLTQGTEPWGGSLECSLEGRRRPDGESIIVGSCKADGTHHNSIELSPVRRIEDSSPK